MATGHFVGTKGDLRLQLLGGDKAPDAHVECITLVRRWACRTVVLRKDALDEREADFYEALYTQSQAQFGAYVSAGTVVNNYAHIFDLLIRLRQACSLPILLFAHLRPLRALGLGAPPCMQSHQAHQHVAQESCAARCQQHLLPVFLHCLSSAVVTEEEAL